MSSIGKFNYLAKTLSRTIRKDSENYVLNAIYNRVADTDLVPVSQQYITNPDSPGGYYLIDLYFPQLNIGIECDEGHHKRQENHDKERELTIIDVLSSIRNDSTYRPIHIDVTKKYDDIEADINDAVKTIKNEITSRKAADNFKCWDDFFPDNEFKLLRDKGYIKVSDNVTFHTITDVDNQIFGKNSKGQQNTWYRITDEFKAWFPKLAINGKAPTKWNNQISLDGTTITEFNEETVDKNENIEKGEEHKRVTFAMAKDPITGIRAYRFVGVFEHKRVVNGKHIYEKVSDRFDIIAKK